MSDFKNKVSSKNKATDIKTNRKITDNWIGTNSEGDYFHSDNTKDRDYNKVLTILDIPLDDLPDWKQSNESLGEKRKNNKEKNNG